MAKKQKEVIEEVQDSEVEEGSDGEDAVYAVEKILGHRVDFDEKDKCFTRFTVKWEGYDKEHNTHEPRESLEEGADTMLQEYCAAQEALGVHFYKDGTRRHKMTQPYEMRKPSKKRKESAVNHPSDPDASSASLAPPAKKKHRVEEIKDASPPPQPPLSSASSTTKNGREKPRSSDTAASASSSKKREKQQQLQPVSPPPETHKRSSTGSGKQIRAEANDFAEEELPEIAPPTKPAGTSSSSRAAGSNDTADTLAEIKAALPKDSPASTVDGKSKKATASEKAPLSHDDATRVSSSKPPSKTKSKEGTTAGSVNGAATAVDDEDEALGFVEDEPAGNGKSVYEGVPSWEELLEIDTLEQSKTPEIVLQWFVTWTKLNKKQWITNEEAKAKFPQRVIAFYEGHLKFRPGELNEDDAAEE